MFRRTVRDEELAAVCILPFIRHANDTPAIVRKGAVELVCEVLAPDGGAALARARRVAALDHEVADVAVEEDAVVVAFLGEVDKVPDGAGGEFWLEFDVEVAEGGLDAGVTFLLDAAGFKHVFFVGEESAFAGGVGGEAGGGEGCGGFAGCVLSGVVGNGFCCVGGGRRRVCDVSTVECGVRIRGCEGRVTVGIQADALFSRISYGFFGLQNLGGVSQRLPVDIAAGVIPFFLLLLGQGAYAVLQVFKGTEVPGFNVLWILYRDDIFPTELFIVN